MTPSGTKLLEYLTREQGLVAERNWFILTIAKIETEAALPDVETLTPAVIEALDEHDWGVYQTPPSGGAVWVDRRRVAEAILAALEGSAT